jgi:ribonuclease III
MAFELAECQRVIGYHFANPRLLEVALTHSSLRTPDRECNERLEFLGDSVLGLVVTEELYRLLPDQAEGELTRLKSAIVSRGALFGASQRLGLARFAEFARGVGRHDELPVSVIANLVEAVIGAIYLDAGYFPAREFVLRHLGAELEETLSDRGAKNYKSLLQHEVQETLGATPTYRTLEEGGPDHRKQFVVAAVLRGQEWGRAEGSTKKEAEQEAARRALEAFQRRGRGRRRRGGSREGLAREVAEHVDEPSDITRDPARGRELPPDVEAGAHEPAPDFQAPPRAPVPEHDGFALGLDVAASAAPATDRATAKAGDGARRELGAAPARKKAPGAWTPPPEDEGFGSGL